MTIDRHGSRAVPPEPGPPRRRAALPAALAGVAFLALAALSSFLPGGGGQGGGSPSSSYSDREGGTSAWAELLARFGHPVERLRGDLDTGSLDPATTVVVLDAPGLSGPEARGLARFVRAGGHLVAGGDGADRWLRSVLDEPPEAEHRSTTAAGPVGSAPAPEVDGIRTVRTAGRASWGASGQLAPILSGGDRVIAVAGDVDRGRVVALADPTPLQNSLLARDDNAALALGLAGGAGRPVRFAEGPHGYGRSGGLGALPRRWRLALAGFGIAAAVWLVARSRRLGPPEEADRLLPPARWAYVEAVTATLARTHRPQEATEPVRRRARQLIARRAGLPPDAADEEIHRAALHQGLGEDEAAALVGAGPSTDASLLAAGRALARLTGPPKSQAARSPVPVSPIR